MLDRPPVFVDPLAKAMLSEEAQSRLDADPWRGNRGKMQSHLRAFLAVRSRVADDCLASAVAGGVRQYVVLGAGLDTFACRNPYPDLRVFEVDHPRTQAWKRSRLKAAALDPSGRTTFVPIDFNNQTLEAALADCGFNGAQSTAISWLGVVPYLESNAVWATLRWAGGVTHDAGHIVFDYGAKAKWWRLDLRYAQRRLAERVARAGEPFRTMLSPDQLHERLTLLGFDSIADMDYRELNKRYFANRSDDLRVAGGGHVVIASRKPR